MKLEIDTEYADRDELVCAANLLLTLVNMRQGAPITTAPASASAGDNEATVLSNGASASPPQPSSSVGDGAVSPTADTTAVGEPVKRGPGRPKKAASVAASSAAAPTASGAEPSAPAASAEAPTMDDLRAALQKLTSATGDGMQKGIDLLKQFNCQRISEVNALPADKQREFIAACAA